MPFVFCHQRKERRTNECVPCLREFTADWYKTSMMAASPHDIPASSSNAGYGLIKFLLPSSLEGYGGWQRWWWSVDRNEYPERPSSSSAMVKGCQFGKKIIVVLISRMTGVTATTGSRRQCRVHIVNAFQQLMQEIRALRQKTKVECCKSNNATMECAVPNIVVSASSD